MLGEQGHAKVTLLKLDCVCDLPDCQVLRG